MERANKYWLDEKAGAVFCENEKDCINNYVEECYIRQELVISEKNEENYKVRHIDFDTVKGNILWKLWKEKEKKLMKRKEDKDKDRCIIRMKNQIKSR